MLKLTTIMPCIPLVVQALVCHYSIKYSLTHNTNGVKQGEPSHWQLILKEVPAGIPARMFQYMYMNVLSQQYIHVYVWDKMEACSDYLNITCSVVLFMYIMCCIYVVNIHNIDNLCTLFCRFKFAPAFISSTTSSVLPFPAATINAVFPPCDDRHV